MNKKETLQEVKKWLIKNVGTKCNDYDKTCFVCQSWKWFEKLSHKVR